MTKVYDAAIRHAEKHIRTAHKQYKILSAICAGLSICLAASVFLRIWKNKK